MKEEKRRMRNVILTNMAKQNFLLMVNAGQKTESINVTH